MSDTKAAMQMREARGKLARWQRKRAACEQMAVEERKSKNTIPLTHQPDSLRRKEGAC